MKSSIHISLPPSLSLPLFYTLSPSLSPSLPFPLLSLSFSVHCRMRRVDSRKHAAPSTSSNTYWQIEKQEDPICGKYTQQYKLHSITQIIKLVIFACAHSWIILLPIGDVISWGDRCRLRHLPTRCYLAVQRDGEDWMVNEATICSAVLMGDVFYRLL